VRIQPAPASPRPSCAALHSSLAKRRPIRAARHPISALDLFCGRLRTRTAHPSSWTLQAKLLVSTKTRS
jgi:hypothetical protein